MFNIKDKKRVIIKLGTSTLTHKTGRLNIRRVEKLVKIIADLENSGLEIIIVSSGAIGLGMSKIGLSTRPKDTPSKQACAAVGQCELMDIYDKLFDAYGIKIGQILLTKYVIDTPRKNNVLNTINKLIEFGVIPIVNENDTVAIDELELDFGENDSLAAFVAIMSKSDLLVIMSDIDGLFDGNPNDNPNAKLIPFIEDISDEIRGAAGGAGSMLGSGGMATKIKAAEIVTEAGIDMAIINGKDPENLYKLFDGEEIGSIFVHKS